MNVFQCVIELAERSQNVVVESALPNGSVIPSLFSDPLIRCNFYAHQNTGNRRGLVG
jgi:hypothetical protein